LDFAPQEQKMKEPWEERKKSLAEAAKEPTLMLAFDPLLWICVLGAFGKSWKAGFAILALMLGAWVFVVWITWLKHPDI
jgi:hypothetical protein